MHTFLEPNAGIGRFLPVAIFLFINLQILTTAADETVMLEAEIVVRVNAMKGEESDWRVIHSTWSFIRPIDVDFSGFRKVVV